MKLGQSKRLGERKREREREKKKLKDEQKDNIFFYFQKFSQVGGGAN